MPPHFEVLHGYAPILYKRQSTESAEDWDKAADPAGQLERPILPESEFRQRSLSHFWRERGV